MKTNLEINVRILVSMLFCLITACSTLPTKIPSSKVATAPQKKILVKETLDCPSPMEIICQAYSIISTKYIRKIPDDELMTLFITGAKHRLSKMKEEVAIPSTPIVCSLNMQKLCDTYIEIKNTHGNLSDQDLTNLFIEGALDELNLTDPYNRYLGANEKEVDAFLYSGVGLILEKQKVFPYDMIVRLAKPSSPASKAGIKRGDHITHIDGMPVRDMTKKEATSRIRGNKGTKVHFTLTIGCEDKTLNTSLTRQDIRDISSGTVKILDKHFGYIRLAEFNANSAIKIKLSIESTENGHGPIKGLILDLRDNPGGNVLESVKLVANFVGGEGAALYDLGQNKTFISWLFPKESVDILPNRPIVVLVNEDSASASELTAGALQEYRRATILGVTTYGKGCLQSVWHLKDQSQLSITRAYTFSPHKTPYDKIGVHPDIVVEEGNHESCTGDVQLARALQILHEKSETF